MTSAPPDRRARRRRQTIEEILRIAGEVMTEDGVNGLSIAEIARRLGVQPPSIYKYFPSLMAVYDELFARGQREHLDAMRAGMASGEPGLDALTKGLEASGRWGLQHRAVAELLFWRPVPNFVPSAESMAPSEEMVAIQRRAVADAVAAGELGAEADSIETVYLVATLIAGALGQAIANEPDVAWGEGRFTRQFSTAMQLLPALYPPTVETREVRVTRPRGRRATAGSATRRPGSG
jgi:AcrR family transcriptional regulator